MKKYFYLAVVTVVLSACATKPFEGKISYEAEFKTGLGNQFRFLDNIIGQATNSTIDLYIKNGKAMVITEANNPVFGSFRGAFTKVIYDLDEQQVKLVNDKDKTYMVESLLENQIEGFRFDAMASQLDSARKSLGKSTGLKLVGKYNCLTYELDDQLIRGKVALSEDLLAEMRNTIVKIDGMEDYDLSGLGFPLYIENKLFGKVGMTIEASKIEHKELENSIFNLDGYRKIKSLEFYEQNLENLDLEALGLKEEFNALKEDLDSLSLGIVEGVSGAVDSLIKDVNAEGIMDGINSWFEKSKKEE